jgi:circadian clock protein KaiB
MLRLYVAGDSERSRRAVRHLEALCAAIGPAARYEVVDVMDDPHAAEAARVLMTPTLVRERPGPARRVIGDLSETGRVLDALGLPHPPAAPARPDTPHPR